MLPSCAAQPDSHGVPAVIVDPTSAGRAELTRVLAEALGGTAPIVADDALTTGSLLSLERGRARDSNSLPLNGRDLSRPEIFALYQQGSRCVLVRLKTGKAWTLQHTACRPLPPAAAPPSSAPTSR